MSDGLFRLVAVYSKSLIVGHRLSLGGPMTDALNRAQRYRDLAEEYHRLAAIDSATEKRARYLRMAEYYSKLAEAEEAKHTSARE